MDSKIKCLKCGSYIHDADHCWNLCQGIFCYTNMHYKKSCDCNRCKLHEICKYCNNYVAWCGCVGECCSICNEHLKNFYDEIKCLWNHTELPCQFCNLPIYKFSGTCLNYHRNNPLCKECNMPELFSGDHKHDGTLCKNCSTLLNHGKCIYRCVNGGNRCIHCCCEYVVNNVCLNCKKDQTGQLTKAAIK